MTKCHVTEELCGLYAALFMDAAAAFPALTSEFLRDQDHLCQLVESRGLHLFLVDLPTAGKHLDRCLDAGKYTFIGLPLTKRVSKKERIPRLFRGLYALVFDEFGNLKEDYCVEAIFFLRQFHNCGKKTRVDCREGAVNTTVESFLSVDESLPLPTWEWEEGPFRSDPDDLFIGEYSFANNESARDLLRAFGHNESRVTELLACLDSVADRATAALGAYAPQEWRFRHGPGAIAETSGPVNKYSTWNWNWRLESEFPIADCGFHNWSAWAAAVDTEWADFGPSNGILASTGQGTFSDPPSRLVAVPKSFSGPRLIAVEPCCHMWCQQNLLDYFVNRVQATWLGRFIKFDDQTYNQSLCRKGSVDGSLATLDLKDASDRMSCATVASTFKVNPRLLRALAATRTQSVCIPADLYDRRKPIVKVQWQNSDQTGHRSVLGYVHKLRKFSTMGNACTFPVQSIVFATISISATLLSRGLRVTEANIRKLEGEVAVFGDDIIVPKESRALVQTLLEALGFKVNETKSFSEGFFRESCGIDCFRGVCVTPVYYKGTLTNKPESMASRVEVINNFKRKFLLHSSTYLATAIPKHRKVVAVRMGSGVFGLQMYCKPIGQIHKIRFNEYLQCTETLVLLIKSMNSKVAIKDDSALLQYFTENPDPFTFWESGVAQKPSATLHRGWVKCEALQEVKAE